MVLKSFLCVSAFALVMGGVSGSSLTSYEHVPSARLCPTLAHMQAYLRVNDNLTPEDSETFRLLATEKASIPQERVKRIWKKFVDLYNSKKAEHIREERKTEKIFSAASPDETTEDHTEANPLSKDDDFINAMSVFSQNEQRQYEQGYLPLYHALAGQIYYLQRFYWPEFFKQLDAYAGDYVFRAGILHTLKPTNLRPFESVDDLREHYKPIPWSRIVDGGVYCNVSLSSGRETSLSSASSAYMFDKFGSVTPTGVLQLLTPFFIKFGLDKELALRISQDAERIYNSVCKDGGNALVQIGLPYDKANQLASFIWVDGSKYDPRIAPLFKEFLISANSDCELRFLHYMLENIGDDKKQLKVRINNILNTSLTNQFWELGRLAIMSKICEETVKNQFLNAVVEYKRLEPFSFKDWSVSLAQMLDKKDLSLSDMRALTNEVLLFPASDLYERAKIFSSFRYPEKCDTVALQSSIQTLVGKHISLLRTLKYQPLSVFLPLGGFFRDRGTVNIASVNTTFVLLLMNGEYVEAEVLAKKYEISYPKLRIALDKIYDSIKQGLLPPAFCCAMISNRSFPEETAFALKLGESLMSSMK